jgi:uroporphyrinogen decarboxylase
MSMTSQERVATALRLEEPDQVPWIELFVDPYLAEKLLQWGGPDNQTFSLEENQYNLEQAIQLSSFLGLDNFAYIMRAPVYAHLDEGIDGRLYYGKGMIKTEADLDLIHFPDPYDEELYTEAEDFVTNKGDYSAWFVTRIGLLSVMLGMGTEAFSFALYDNLPLVEKLLDMYCDWICVVAERINKMGFDVFCSTDDMAFNINTFFSPAIFKSLVMPRYERVREKIGLPWVIHSDGNMMPFMDDLMSLGIAGFHPNEKGAMDIRLMKNTLGDRLCLFGNVDLNILGLGSPDEVDSEVRELIRDIAPGGGYIISSGNCLAGYLKPENVLAMRDAIQKYGQYPIRASIHEN